MVEIINEKSKRKDRFLQINVSTFKGHLGTTILDIMIQASSKAGVKRNNYYIIRTDVNYNFNIKSIEIMIIQALLMTARRKQYNYLMIINI